MPNFQPQGGGEGEPDAVELDPPLEIIDAEDVTPKVFHRGCLYLGIDPDDVLAGKDLELPTHPKWDHTTAFLKLVLENYEAYDFGEMRVDRFKSVLAVVAHHFMSGSAGSSGRPTPSSANGAGTSGNGTPTVTRTASLRSLD